MSTVPTVEESYCHILYNYIKAWLVCVRYAKLETGETLEGSRPLWPSRLALSSSTGRCGPLMYHVGATTAGEALQAAG